MGYAQKSNVENSCFNSGVGYMYKNTKKTGGKKIIQQIQICMKTTE
jgi:hypothetical protein